MSARERDVTTAVTVWLYRWFLLVLPRGFRAAYGRDSVEMFADRVRAVSLGRGGFAVIGCLFRALWDLVLQAVRLRVERGRGELVIGAAPRRGFRFRLDDLRVDVRHAVRQLWRAPGFAVAVLATIAVGVGANTAMFGVVDGVILRPLPFPSPESLAMVWERNESRGWPRFTVSPANWLDWRERSDAFSVMAAYTGGTETLLEGGDPERVNALYIDSRLFEVLGKGPALGRGFTAAEMETGGDDAVILSHRVWVSRFGADPSILDRTVSAGGVRLRVVGVLPADFGFRPDVDVWMPLTFPFDVAGARGAHYLNVLGRLRPGVSVDAAQAGIESIAGNLAVEYAESNAGWSAVVVPLHEQIVGGVRRSLLILFGAVGFVLLIACVNVMSLLLARGAGRSAEFGVRGALGAGPGRIAQQMVVESLFLSVLGAGAGLVIAGGLTRLVVVLEPAGLPRLENLSLDFGVALFCVALSLMVGVVAGLMPALRASRDGMARGIRSVRTGGGTGIRRLQRGLLVAEIALAVVLLVGFGLLTRSLVFLNAVDPGFRAAGLVTARLSPPSARYPEAADRARFYDDVVERLRAVPHIAETAVTTRLPLDGGLSFGFHRSGDDDVPPAEWPSGELRAVDADYFATMGIPLVRGRPFQAGDVAGSPSVVIVNETLARTHLAGRDPIGERIEVSSGDAACPCEIVGVVADVRESALDQPPVPVYYLPQTQSVWTSRSIVVRSDAPLSDVVASLRAAVAAVDPELAIFDVQTVQHLVDRQLSSSRFRVTVFGLFAVLALVLAAVGIYGVMSYIVGQRKREIGVRAALGASSGELIWMVEREAFVATGAGIAIGLLAALVATRLLQSLLFGVQPFDPTVVVSVAAFLGLVGTASAFVPAWRAGRVDPVRVLRSD